MAHFPLFISLEKLRILVIGGGIVAARRVRSLIACGAKMTVIAPRAQEEFAEWERRGIVHRHRRAYRDGDCSGFDMVLACTDDRACNHAVYREAAKLGIWHNSCDRKEECNFYFPGLAVQGDCVIGVSCSGKDHKKAKALTQSARHLLQGVDDEATTN